MMNNKKRSLFFRKHENRQNKIIIRVMTFFLILYPLLIIAQFLGVFSQVNTIFLLELCIVLGATLLFSWLFLRFEPLSPAIKYVMLSSLEFIVFMLSIDKYIPITFAYLLVPLLSSIYLNKKTTKISILVCYIIMIISLYIRSLGLPDYEGKITRIKWFIGYTGGYTLEYSIVSVILYFLSVNNNIMITSDYNSTKTQIRSQTIITASFIELINKSANIDEFHPKRCSEYAKLICKFLRLTKEYSEVLNEENINYIVTATLVHDIGLWAIPERILQKETPLTELEQQQFKLHTIQGEELFRQNMKNSDKKYIETCCDVILYHHEQWNGQGYPFQITETAIPLAARIVFAANEIDKQTRSNFNNKIVSFSEAIDNIKRMGGREIDPLIANIIWENKDAFMFAYEKIKLTM